MPKATKPRRKHNPANAQSVALRRQRFVTAYLTNGFNGKEAAITAGFSRHSASRIGVMLLREPRVKKLLAEALEKAGRIAGLEVERTLLEVARLAYSDKRRFYRKDGSLIPIPELDDDCAAALASIEVEELPGKRSGVLKKLKLWDKNAALEKAMRYHGLYKEDNKQRGESLPITVIFGKE